MITIRRSAERGRTRKPWLDSRHTFSFDTYQDPEHMGYRALRVINEDHVAGGEGFGLHPHQDMEIFSFVFKGTLEHEDDLGNREQINAGEVQRISAGTGIKHAERNPGDEDVHFLQVWILPEHKGMQPGYEKGGFPKERRLNKLYWLASRDGRGERITVHQDVDIYTSLLEQDMAMEFRPEPEKYYWLQLIKGGMAIGNERIEAGDGVAISDEHGLWLVAKDDSDFLLFALS